MNTPRTALQERRDVIAYLRANHLGPLAKLIGSGAHVGAAAHIGGPDTPPKKPTTPTGAA